MFANHLRKLRKEKKLSQAELGEILKLSQRIIFHLKIIKVWAQM